MAIDLQDAVERLTVSIDKLNTAAERRNQLPNQGGNPSQAMQQFRGMQTQNAGQNLGNWLSRQGRGRFSRMAFRGAGALVRRQGAKLGASQAAGAAGSAAARAGAAGLGGEAAAALGPAGIAVAVILASVSALNMFREKVVESAKEQQKLNFHYAQFSAAMANVQVQSEIATMFRERDIGNDTSGTARYLSEQNTAYDNTAAEFEKLWSNFKNLGLGVLLEALTEVIQPIVPVVQELNSLIKQLLPAQPQPTNDAAAHLQKAKDEVMAAQKAGDKWAQRRQF